MVEVLQGGRLERCYGTGRLSQSPPFEHKQSICELREYLVLMLSGRGNLNRFFKILILIDYFRLNFLLEYLLEYHPRNLLDSRLYVIPKLDPIAVLWISLLKATTGLL